MIQISFFHWKVSNFGFYGNASVAKSGISLYHPVEEEEKPFCCYCVETGNIKS